MATWKQSGYDLYCKMLNEAVKELKGELEPEEEFEHRH